MLFFRKTYILIFIRIASQIASRGDSNKYTKCMIHKKTVQFSCFRRVHIKFLYNSKFDLTAKSLVTNSVVVTKIRYNVYWVCTTISVSCIFFIDSPMLFFRKTYILIFIRIASQIASRGDSNKYTKCMIHKKLFNFHALDGSISSFFTTAYLI